MIITDCYFEPSMPLPEGSIVLSPQGDGPVTTPPLKQPNRPEQGRAPLQSARDWLILLAFAVAVVIVAVFALPF